MCYWTNIFTTKNWFEFLQNGSNRCGFPLGRQKAAQKVKIGDHFVCYLSKDSKFCGIVEVKSDYYIDFKPMYSDLDPYPVRFNVIPVSLTHPENALSAKSELIREALFGQANLPKGWCGKLKLRQCLNNIDEYGHKISEFMLFPH